MRVKVVRMFRDKYTHQLHKKNTEIEVTEERFEELNSTSLGVLVEEIKVDEEQSTDENELEDTQNEVKNAINTDKNGLKTDQKPSKKGKK